MREDDFHRVSRQGTEAWRRLKKDKSWEDWMKVGEALCAGREWAMNQVSTNRPEGKAYNMAFGEWLTRFKLDDMDKGDRSRLFAVMDNLPNILEWRRTLTLYERLRLNHPSTILRKWKAAFEPERTKDEKSKPTLRDSVADLSEEVEALKRTIAEKDSHIADLEAARENTESRIDQASALRFLITEVSRRGINTKTIGGTPGFSAADITELRKWLAELATEMRKDAPRGRKRLDSGIILKV